MYRIATNAALMKLRKERPRRNLTQPGYEEIELPGLFGEISFFEAVFRSEFERVHQFLHGLGIRPCPHLRYLVIHGRGKVSL